MTPPRQRAFPWFEQLEDRLAPASLAPKSLLIYYGYPSQINGATTNAAAAAQLGRYDYIVLGDALELATHPDHGNTLAILGSATLTHTKAFGYVDLGVSTQNLAVTEIESRIDAWKNMGVAGIFLDDFGYDFGTDRARQNTVVDYAHGKGLPVVANAFVPDDAFGSGVDATYNPTGTATELNASDFYLYESQQIEVGAFVAEADWQTKAQALASYQAALGFKVLSITTNDSGNAYDLAKFDYAWYSALLYGHEATGWGEFDYSALSNDAQFRARPAVAPGSTFTSAVTASGDLFTRTTNAGLIQVDAAAHTGSFTPTGAPSTTVARAGYTVFRVASHALVLSAFVSVRGSAVNSGTVSFALFDGSGNVIGSPVTSATVKSGMATVNYLLPAGTGAGVYQIIASYDGSPRYLSSSGSARITILAASSAVAASRSSATLGVDSSATLQAVVTSSADSVNEGSVVFTVRDARGKVVASPVTSSTPVDGQASASFPLPAGLQAGTYRITASFGTALDFRTSSATALLTVAPAASVTTAADIVASFSASAQTLTLTATVTSALGPVDSGRVSFTVLDASGRAIGTAALSGTVTSGTASATFTLPARTKVGTYKIRAVYGGSVYERSSLDATKVLTVS